MGSSWHKQMLFAFCLIDIDSRTIIVPPVFLWLYGMLNFFLNLFMFQLYAWTIIVLPVFLWLHRMLTFFLFTACSYYMLGASVKFEFHANAPFSFFFKFLSFSLFFWQPYTDLANSYTTGKISEIECCLKSNMEKFKSVSFELWTSWFV